MEEYDSNEGLKDKYEIQSFTSPFYDQKQILNPRKEENEELNIKNYAKKDNIINNNIINNKDNSEAKNKRKRRKKNEIIHRLYKCSECEKSYLSSQALLIHKKHKHIYLNFEKRSKGRPSKLNHKVEDEERLYKKKYQFFFKEDKRKYKNEKNTSNKNKNISSSLIKEELEIIFNSSKYQLLFGKEEISNNSFYKIITCNWDKENPELDKESLSEIESINVSSNKVKMTNLDGIFFIYLKEVSEKTNITYFSFIIKFIVIFREYINKLKNDLVKKEIQNGKKIYYSQIYNAESIPKICNDIFKNLEENNFFDLDKYELIEIAQHFCYWLYINHYSEFHLTLL